MGKWAPGPEHGDGIDGGTESTKVLRVVIELQTEPEKVRLALVGGNGPGLHCGVLVRRRVEMMKVDVVEMEAHMHHCFHLLSVVNTTRK